ncbi:thioredoxin family protein [Thalassococcus sp. CAU 1522]|uniref:Thioredoxin family protein n=1 Tax=Thalassococcus arenae TaxID=2851652 RepID=A0ABS6N8J1_9RHOB|nr:thioredoxin family protein [Thalassococcus arenae]MBV2360335.1 thioredoxin family protein [Thalassococcus arenae]
MIRAVLLSAATLIGSIGLPATAEPRLVMVDQPGCVYCELWDRQIAPAYSKTAEGQFAPLWRVDIADGAPEGVAYARRVTFTPTFILIDEGRELGRIEGYPGEDFFWPLFAQLLERHTDYQPDLMPATN